MDELPFLSAIEQADLVRRGEVASAELVELYLGRIERLDPELNAFVTVCADEARAAAAARASAAQTVTYAFSSGSSRSIRPR